MTSRSKRPNNRQRGKRGEREARDEVRRCWGATGCIRAAQANGKYSADLLHCDPGDQIHLEVKLRRRLSVQAFMDQAARDCGGNIPVVLMRQDGGEWLVMLRCTDSKGFVNALSEQLRKA